jgi:hypothetical protein
MQCDKVKVHRYGLMEVSILDNGKTIEQMAKEYCIMQIAIFMMDNG